MGSHESVFGIECKSIIHRTPRKLIPLQITDFEIPHLYAELTQAVHPHPRIDS